MTVTSNDWRETTKIEAAELWFLISPVISRLTEHWERRFHGRITGTDI